VATETPSAAIMHKCRRLILLMNVHLNHFPKHEKYGLCQEIRQTMYGVFAGLVECQKRYHNKTSLTRLDVQHEQLRALTGLAFELGYYGYKHNKREYSEAEALRRYTAASVLVDELGAMIGGWIKSLKSEL
jgi:hypothetical protein